MCIGKLLPSLEGERVYLILEISGWLASKYF